MSLEMPERIVVYGMLKSGKFALPVQIRDICAETAMINEEEDGKIRIANIRMLYHKKEFFEMPIDTEGRIVMPSELVVRHEWLNQGFDVEIESFWCLLMPTKRPGNLFVPKASATISDAVEYYLKHRTPVIINGDKKDFTLAIREIE